MYENITADMVEYSKRNNMPEFTIIELKIITELSDGLPHKRKDLMQLLRVKEGNPSNLNTHISRIRQKIRPLGQDIICELIGFSINFRHVRLLKSNNE